MSLTFGQAQDTKNSADQTLRSNGRVNPSTLGMEMDIPLGGYRGRGISLPLGLSYSSKLWRFEEHSNVPLSNGNTNVYVNAKYSENAASGWTSSLSQPYIEYTDEITHFDGYGRPLSEMFGGGTAPPGIYYVKRVTVYLPGGSYELRAQETPISLANGANPTEESWNGTYYASDGSGVKYVQDNSVNPPVYKLWMPDGSFYDFNTTRESKNTVNSYMQVRRAIKLTDANGNYVQFNAPDAGAGYPDGSWTDQLGRTFPVMMPREAPSIPVNVSMVEQTFTLPTVAQTSTMPQVYALRWKYLESAFTPNQNYQLKYSGHTDRSQPPNTFTPNLFYDWHSLSHCISSGGYLFVLSGGPGKFNPVVLTDIVLPNGQTYSFSYNEYGEIDRVHYPTGGREELQYDKVASLAELAVPYQMSNRGVQTRKIYESDADITADTWTYTAASSETNFRTSTIAPDGTQTDRFMHRGVPSPGCASQSDIGTAQNYYGTRWGYDSALAGMAYEERSFSSTGQILQRTLTKWTATDTTTGLTVIPQRYVQRNARVINTESIVYDGDAGLSAVTTLDYDTDVAALGSPLNVTRMTRFAYNVVSGGSVYSPATATQAPSDEVPITAGTTAVKKVETAYNNTTDYKNRNLVKLPIQVIVRDGQNNIKAKSEVDYDDAGYLQSDSISGTVPGWNNLGTTVRGLPTTSRNWYDIGSNPIVTRTQFDQFGNVRKNWDGKGNFSEIQYTDNYTDSVNRNSYALKTKTISYLGANGTGTTLETSVKYDFNTGLPRYTIDLNNQQTEIQYADALLRPTKTIAPNGHQTITEYGVPDYSGKLPAEQRFIKVKTQIDAQNWKEGYTWFDGLGRAIKSQSVDLNGDVFAITCYDQMGRLQKTSNPFRNVSNPTCSTNLEWTTTTYDNFGRLWKVTAPGGAVVETTYGLATSGSQIGRAVTVKDQALKERRSITNSLGQLIRVDEPDDYNNHNGQLGTVSSPYQPTVYSYDTLNNLTLITQGGQTRAFVYDALSRLKQATNPEMGTTPTTGTVYYQYDNNGNLELKTDARGVQTNYVYDTLNRITQRSYSNEPAGQAVTPMVTYTYDSLTNAKGRLTKVVTGSVLSPFSVTDYQSFDISGRITQSQQTTDGTAYAAQTYTYNLSGALIEEKYPSGRVVRNVLNNAGELSIVQSKKNANAGYWNYADNFTYTAAGAVSSMQLGNGKWESTQFNSRLQPTQIALGTTQSATNVLKLDYSYGTTANNGNVQSQIITVPTVGSSAGFTATQAYIYDSLNRLKSAEETIPSQTGWKQTFDYDRYGNRNFDAANTTATATFLKNCNNYTTVCAADVPIVNPTVSTSNNRLNGYTFDNAGNTTRDAQSRKFTYDGENKQTKVETVNGSGAVTGTVGEYLYDGDGKRIKKKGYTNGVITEETIFVYDASGKLVAEYSTTVETTNAKVSYLTNDHLGSPRINTDANGAVTARNDYQPFGEKIATSQRIQDLGYSSDTIKKKFTGYERDDESNLDFAEARMYSSNLGRFTAVDPLMASADSNNPQTFNRYVYVGNNPINITDPLGLDWLKSKKRDANGLYTYKNAFDESLKELLDGGEYERVDFNGSTYFDLFRDGVPIYRMFANGTGHEIQTSSGPDNISILINTIADESERKGKAVAIMAGVAVLTGTGVGFAMAATGTAAGVAITTLGLVEAGAAPAAAVVAVVEINPNVVTQAVQATTPAIQNVNQLLSSMQNVEQLTSKTQGFVQGNAQQIFNNITQGGTKITDTLYKMPDGTFVKLYNSSTNGVASISLNIAGQMTSVRITP